ncbi:hypothetical protein G647_09707 [Cladophialophora carrionii CBS 160.54]|uniref:polynucleotide adenylyltransferase n=1 Tax=Cladophialophora carrionii CBS 160.54 TaxID=1279043 RepID=V9DLI7_9EURO|nr:uncharacterized protein G647_09707 [Cladophialophora carrionii CBS 160.54]ETI27516.1 hypothetical protein G647_09707 [Cladophialophora carrionii CBS 160.54]
MDSYRPGGTRRPPVRDSDSYRPRDYDPPAPPWPSTNYSKDAMYHFQGSRDREPPREFVRRPRPGYQSARPHPTGSRRDNWRRPPPPTIRTAANRPLFKLRHDEAADSSAASLNLESKSKFRNLDELTDSEEEDMAQSEDEDEERHMNKRARLHQGDSGIVPASSKWSNPDPYTSLPPAGDVAAKRTDVVKLIRKARIDTDPRHPKAKQADDFISFDADEHDSSEDSALPSLQHASPSPQPTYVSIARQPSASSMVTGKRKRGRDLDDEEERYLRSDHPIYADRRVEDKWTAAYGVNATPWLRPPTPSNTAGVALHKEIIDFYDWVKPKPHEIEVRGAVFQRLNKVLQGFMAGELKAFGSYAAGLYLPTADMDLVYLTRAFKPGVTPSKKHKRDLVLTGATFLRRCGIAQGPVVPISGAKVPIIKFVDRISGLKVDLCFDNDTGVAAIDTFHRWKSEYPVMPIIVSVVKQYLMIRGLNDVSTGGLGGFSTICLVTSLLQHLPVPQRPVNVGDVLLEFFNYYGNVFDKKSTIIRLDPPAYLNKATHPIQFGDKDNERLTIIDPHRSDNNISGGTRQISTIFDCFSKAHKALTTRLASFEKDPSRHQANGFLGCLIGGDFTSYERQRQRLRELSVNATPGPTAGKGGPTIKEPARSIEVGRRPNRTGPPMAAGADGDTTASEKNPKEPSRGRGIRRAERLKSLRPELAASIRHSISILDALKLGGYKDPAEMQSDLSIREAAAAKLAMTSSGPA